MTVQDTHGPRPAGPTFGSRAEGTAYTVRRAAYGVILGAGGTVATVRGPCGRHWLPGGGSLPGECAEDTLAREIGEELGRCVQLTCRIGEATQYFHAASEGRHYRMIALFFLAELTDELTPGAERETVWLPIHQASAALYHECHGWAVSQALAGG